MSLWKFQRASCPVIGSSPHQLRNINFPKEPFGRSTVVYRSFNASWFDQWGCLHWDEASQLTFSFTCVSAFKHKKLMSVAADVAFVTRGYQNWKDATAAFLKHESSSCHKQVVEQVVTIPSKHCDVGECLSTYLALVRKEKCACFLKETSTLKFVAHQGLTLRGDGVGELDSNVILVLNLRAGYEPDGKLAKWKEKEEEQLHWP